VSTDLACSVAFYLAVGFMVRSFGFPSADAGFAGVRRHLEQESEAQRSGARGDKRAEA